MSASTPRMAGGIGGSHPSVRSVRARQRALVAVGALVALAVSLAVAVAVPNPSITALLAGVAGAAVVVALVVEPRLEVTVTILVLYLGLLDGPVKLFSGGHETATVFRDVLIGAICIGAITRMMVARQPIRLPPLSGWVVLWIAFVLAEALNPRTLGLTKALGGFRQELEFVPFFFFGYVLMRSNGRLRRMALILGVIALANGIVSTYQTKLTPQQLGAWGPGYKELTVGTEQSGIGGKASGITGRTYAAGGTTHVRPPALGKDEGFGGTVGMIALPLLLGALATWRRRRRWIPLVLSLGALLAIVTGLARLQVVAAVFAVVVFAALATTSGAHQVKRLVTALLAILVIAVPLVAVLVAAESKGTFSRYAEISPSNASSAKDVKTGELNHLPTQLEEAPFGVGLSTAGAASGFGGKQTELLNGHGVGSDTEYNFIGDELGIPGEILYLGLSLTVLVLAISRLRRVEDPDTRLMVAAVVSIIAAFLVAGLNGPIAANVGGAYYWFATGIAAYWLGSRRVPSRAHAVVVPAHAASHV